MTTLLLFITLTAMALIIYHHVGYPLLLSLITKGKAKTVNNESHHAKRQYQHTTEDKQLPTITIIMPAFNEESMIAEKISNLACLDYPSDKLHVIIACDGCTDHTVGVAVETVAELYVQHLSVDIIDFTENRGKVAVLNDVIPRVDSDLVALSDISALLSIDALLKAAEQFETSNVGVITGLYKMLTPGSEGEEKYWQYQGRVKQNEANLGSTIGVHGAFYIFRRELFTPLQPDTINDDFILPMSIVSQGYQAQFNQDINAVELETMAVEGDHKRRRRIAAGNIQQLWRLKNLLNPKFRGIAFNFASGKALRTIMPFLLLTSLIGCGLLMQFSILFAIAFWGQLAIYIVSYTILAFKPKRCPKILTVIAYIISGYTAGLIGVMRYMLGFEKGPWQRVQ